MVYLGKLVLLVHWAKRQEKLKIIIIIYLGLQVDHHYVSKVSLQKQANKLGYI